MTSEGLVSHRIVIIGAGVAGLSAARELDRLGVSDYVVVEAQSRLGGRVHTVIHDGKPLELGAQFIHGNKGNPVYALAADNKLIVNEPPSDGDEGAVASSFCTVGGQRLSQAACKEVALVVDRIQDRASKFYSSSGNGSNGASGRHQQQLPAHGIAVGGCHLVDSLGGFWRREYEQYLSSASCMSDDEITSQLKVALHDWHDNFQAVENACDGLDSLSLQLWGMYVVRGGDYELSHGYGRVVELLASPAAARHRIWLNSPVVQVDWSAAACLTAEANVEAAVSLEGSKAEKDNDDDGGDGGTILNGTGGTCALSDNAPAQDQLPDRTCPVNSDTACRVGGGAAAIAVRLADGRAILAEHVIVTVSLGCLKRSASTFFIPNLPAAKQGAIEKMQFGTTDKIYLAFDTPFWKEAGFTINFVWLDGDVESFQQLLSNYVQDKAASNNGGNSGLPASWAGEKDPWWKHLLQFHTVRHHPNLLEGWIAGSAAEQMELLAEEDVLLTCWQLLVNFHQHTIPKPKQILRTRWHNTEYVHGSYSSTPPGLTEKDIRAYAKPIYVGKVPRLLFAGEGTHVTDYSTVHGAFMSGVDAAKRLSDYLHSP